MDTSPRVGVGVLLLDDSARVLLSLRRRPPESGAWSILGGRLEPFETVQDCALREVREEAGVEIVLDRLLCVTDHILPDENQHWVAPAFAARISHGGVRNCEPEKTAGPSMVPPRRIAAAVDDDSTLCDCRLPIDS
jgi:ADP-ribose pyrophosphatase YjhB (NUDIX family)